MKTNKSKRLVTFLAGADTPRDNAVRLRYGDAETFQIRWSYENVRAIAGRIDESVAKGVEPMVVMMSAYGSDAVENNLFFVIQGFMLSQKEQKMRTADIRTLAQSITQCVEARTLNYAFVLNFFNELAQGKYDYFPRPRSIMVQFQAYIKSAKERERSLMLELETVRMRRADEETRRNAISFDEYKRRMGIDPSVSNPIDLIRKDMQ